MRRCSAMLAACSEGPVQQPPFYTDLGRAGATLDQPSARDLINSYRANHDLPAVALDPTLTAVAQELADGMARSNEVRLSLDRERARLRRSSIDRRFDFT